jgi:hypothetical protein
MSEAAAQAPEQEATKQKDPMEQFREMRDTYLDIWSKSSIETVNGEDYAKLSGAMLDSYLTFAAPLKEPVEQAMLKTLQQLNMPTSADIVGLSGRLTNIEMNMDNMDAKLDRIEKLLSGLEATTRADATMQAKALGSKLDRIETLIADLKAVASEKSQMPADSVAQRTAKYTEQEERTAKQVRENARKVTR